MKREWGRVFFIKAAFICIIALTASVTAHAKEPREIVVESFPSVVLITMENPQTGEGCLGSGFFVKEGVVATNLHVVEGYTQGKVKKIGGNDTFNIEGTVGIDPLHDLALVSVSGANGKPLPFSNTGTVAVGDKVYVIGNPKGLEGTLSDGLVSGIRRSEEGTEIQISAPISSGSSGGPVLNANGEVIGVAVSTLTSGQNLNFAIPLAYVDALLLKIETVRPLSPTSVTEHKAATLDTSPSPPPRPAQPVAYADGRFIDNGNGTVTDTKTKLIWQIDDSVERVDLMMLTSACRVTLGGRSDWRIPTKKDFQSLELSKYKGVPLPFMNSGEARYYWLGTIGFRAGTFLWNEDKFELDWLKAYPVRLVAGP